MIKFGLYFGPQEVVNHGCLLPEGTKGKGFKTRDAANSAREVNSACITWKFSKQLSFAR